MNAAPRNTILQGDVLEHLRELPDGCVQTVVTSPPYWGLRDYGVAGQIGLEPTPAAYVARMVDVFREVKRVLRDDGTAWVNFGDSYAANQSSNGGYSAKSTLAGFTNPNTKGRRANSEGQRVPRWHALKPKDLVGIPWRVAFALQDDGWYLRSDIVWSKPNPMPESVSDRPTRAHEYIFLLSKRARYYYDAAAVREPAKESDAPSRWKTPDGWDTSAGAGGHGSIHRAGREKGHRTDKQRGHSRRHDGFNDRWDGMSKEEQQVMGANKRDVWTVATHPFPEAHFATFPPKLIEPCILAGSRPGDLVLDPFGGSGTTALVAQQWQRDWLLIELNPAYVEMAQRRLATVPVRLFADGRGA